MSIIPVAPEHIAFVGAAMKMRGYRSFSNYISWAKEAHIAAGHTWTPRHELEAAQGTRSVTRGQGPPWQSAPLPVEDVAESKLGFQASCQGGLVNPGDVVETIEALAHLTGIHCGLQEPVGLRLWACPSSKSNRLLVGHRQSLNDTLAMRFSAL